MSYYTTRIKSDHGDNVSYEAEGPFVCIYVKTRTDLCCIRV